MECYEGATMIKTFRGKIAAANQDTIVLHTNDGSTGYRVVKFQVMPDDPFSQTVKHVMKIYKVSQTSIDDSVDFSDNKLLGVGTYMESVDLDQAGYGTVVFDKEIFNQDIYITHSEVTASQPGNYYIELEQVKLDLGENTVATLKDIRNTKTQGF